MKRFKYLAGLILAIVGFNSCTDNFEELNTPPNAIIATNVNASLLGQAFAQSQMHGMQHALSQFQLAQSLFGDLYSQYFATTQVNFDSDRHTQVGGWTNGAWNNFYNLAARQIHFVEEFSAENGMELENAFAKIWRVQSYHRMTDYYGPIIYSEFGNQQTSVAYDTQESIYKDFFKTLDEAVAVLKANPGGLAFPSHDQMYEGSVNKWLKYANSLRLRLALRVKYVEPDLAKAEAEKAIADGIFLSNDDNATLLTTINSRNPYWTITNWGEFRMSAAMESVLLGFEDPRVGEYFSPTVDYTNGESTQPYKGLRNGLAKIDINGPVLNAAHSDMGLQYINEGRGGSPTGAPIRVISASEVYFLRAEGALENWNMGGTAEELYNKGIEMSLAERTSASAADINAYISSNNTPVPLQDQWNTPALSDIPVAFEAGGGKERQLEQIITQKWIALYPDGWEAWTELRRTGYPKVYPRLNSDNPDVPADQVMRRLVFVEGEFNNNNVAVTAAEQLSELQSRGGNKNSTRLWWDAK
ncbi:SusD/RagB family nutrient-binding outer membrane lipoprotein [soil metagenome]